MFDLVGKRYLFFLVSLIIIIPGVISLFLFGLRLGIDFTGGTLWEVVPRSAEVNTNEVAQLLKDNGQTDVAVQEANLIVGNVTTRTLIMRMPNISPDEKDALTKVLVDRGIISGTEQTVSVSSTAPVTATATTTGTTAPAVETTTVTRIAPGDEIQFNTVGPTIGSEVASRAILSVLAASLGILAYLWYAFRRVPNAIRYGVCAVIALLHDVLVVVGIFSILGELFGIEVDALFITAMLTVIGFSVHDTIVVFDRIRENLLKRRFDSFEKVVNYSLVQTLTRSINTSLTVIFTLSALFLFGGVSIRDFVLALLIGIVSGTYSSIFNASMMLVVWENKEWRNWFGRGKTADTATARTA
ncbi:MAG TPA: protein translocase subunit SecF [Chloroflexia bacterium]